MIIYCIDCKKELSKQADYYGYKRCNSCNKKHYFKNPKNNPRYIDGKTIKIEYCIDCGRKICSNTKTKRCFLCCRKYLGKRQKGKNNPNWVDGRSYEKYLSEFNIIKEIIKKRDDYRCQGENCSMTQEEHFIIYGRDIEVHHIDYNKKNNKEINLLTLCKQCNMRANIDRNYWNNYYTKKVRSIYETAYT